jgi:tetratricopeptide (TPR) repeat protein
MKKILLAVVLGVTVVAAAQDTAQPAQGQSGAPSQGQSQGPVIKDPAEYNAYVAAVQQKDPSAKISGLEAFTTQYPNSVMKNQALELLMGAYQQTNNSKKTMETAAKVVAGNPCNMRALALLAFYNRTLAQNGDPSANLADGKKYAEQGLACWPKITDPEVTKMKPQMDQIFKSAIGIACYQAKDYKCAAESLKDVVDANPADFSVVYPLALAYLNQTPPDYQNGIWFAARAAAVAPAQNKAGIEKYARSQYVKFHAGDDGWAELLAAANANGQQVAIKPAPTPAEQAHDMVVKTPPDKMDFAQWEFILTNGSQEDQDAVWNAIKGKAVQMNGTVISTTPEEFMIAGSSDDIDAKKADITLKFEDKVPAKLIPKDGASLDFQGEPASYTPNPFMMVMEKGRLLNAKPAATTPTHKAPVHKKPAAQ